MTRRESQVQRLVLAGFCNKVIALRLGIAERTVHFHRTNIRAKYRAALSTHEEVTS